MFTAAEVMSALTDENLDDLVTTAWYGGINYWAESLDDEDDFLFVLIDREDDNREHRITAEALRKAYAVLLDNDQPFVNSTIHGYFLDSWRDRDEDGPDLSWIDSWAADVWVQVAAFGKVLYS